MATTKDSTVTPLGVNRLSFEPLALLNQFHILSYSLCPNFLLLSASNPPNIPVNHSTAVSQGLDNIITVPPAPGSGPPTRSRRQVNLTPDSIEFKDQEWISDAGQKLLPSYPNYSSLPGEQLHI